MQVVEIPTRENHTHHDMRIGQGQIDSFRSRAAGFSRLGEIQYRIDINEWFRAGPFANQAIPLGSRILRLRRTILLRLLHRRV
jgi:hypothetical protein